MLINDNKKWDYALGMIKVDGLEPSEEFKKLIAKEKEGKMTLDDKMEADYTCLRWHK